MYLQYYVVVFYLLQLWRFVDHDFLSQIQPSTMVMRHDISGWLLASTGIVQNLILHQGGFLLLDVVYVFLPICCYLLYRWGLPSFIFLLAISYFYFYVLVQSLIPSISLEGTTHIQLIPFLFLVRREKDILLVKDALRYFFCMVFFIAGFWKVYYGGVFEPDQMSRIIYDHNIHYILGTGWERALSVYLVEHSGFAQFLYVAAVVLELSFVVGFFTKRYDRALMILLFAFVVLDLIVMRIPYFPYLSFLIFFVPLYKYKKKAKQKRHLA